MSRNAKTFNNLLDSLNRLTGHLLPFIAPVISPKQKTCTVQFGKSYHLSLPEIPVDGGAFPVGWYLLAARDKTTAGVERKAFPIERMEYLRQLPKFTALTLYPINGGYLALRLNPLFPTQEPFPVYLTGEMSAPLTPFTITVVRQLGQIYPIHLYDTTLNDRDNDLIQGKLLDAIRSGGNIHSFPETYMKAFSLVKEANKTAPIDTLNLQPVWYGDVTPKVSIPGLCLTGEQYDLPTIITVMSRKAA